MAAMTAPGSLLRCLLQYILPRRRAPAYCKSMVSDETLEARIAESNTSLNFAMGIPIARNAPNRKQRRRANTSLIGAIWCRL
jgi:hypothetical protein